MDINLQLQEARLELDRAKQQLGLFLPLTLDNKP